MADIRRVALLFPYGSGYFRQVLLGVGEYVHPARRWLLWRRNPSPELLAGLERWKPDGIIAYVHSAADWRGLTRWGVPVVAVSSCPSRQITARVGNDDLLVGHLAGRYLRDRGFKRLAFVGRAGASYAHVRLKGLREQVAPLGIQVKSLESTDRAAGPEPGFVQQERVLDDWLGSLDAPVGVLASNDNIGRLVSESAFRLGIAVPEEMAILSVDNDDVICAMAYPPMSSVELAGRRIGQTAAGILERLMAGEEVPEPQRRVLLPPLGVVTRQSTDTVAVSDPHVAAAVRYIREHVDESLSVGQVLRHVPVARRTLEQRFRRHLGRTPLEEIRLAKLDRARYLLAATAEPIARIACQCGFRDAAFFSRVFREACGLSPSAYRKEQRGEW